MKILSATRLEVTNRYLLSENTETTNVTPDTMMYRYCSDQEIECIANGGQSGMFWLATPYYGIQAHKYIRTTWANLGKCQQGSYGVNGQDYAMTANGIVQDKTLMEIVEVRAGNPEPVVTQNVTQLLWKTPELRMLANREFPDMTTQEEVDDYSEPVVSVRWFKFYPAFPFRVTDEAKQRIVQSFTTWEEARKFCYKYVKEGFCNNLAHRN